MRITTALRRTRTPAVPMKNSTAETAMNAPSGTATSTPAQSLGFAQETRSWLVDSLVAAEPPLAQSIFIPFDQHDRADHGRQEKDRRDLERKSEVAEHARRERQKVAALCARCGIAEGERHERDEDRDRHDKERGPVLLGLEEQAVGAGRLRREHHAVQDQDRDGADVDEDLEHCDRFRAE